jgi:protein ImuA
MQFGASQIGSYRSTVVKSGFPSLDNELPGGGWPASALIALLLQQNGFGELRLLRPALKAVGQKRAVVLIDPPYTPNAAAWSEWGLSADQLLLFKARRTADA